MPVFVKNQDKREKQVNAILKKQVKKECLSTIGAISSL